MDKNIPPGNETAQISSTLQGFNVGITFLGFVTEILIFLPLIFNITSKNSNLTSGFFTIFTIGCGVDLAYCIAKILMELTNYQIAVVTIYANLAQWYCLLFFPCWLTVIALNRLTALIFMRVYQKLWSGKILFLISLILSLYPFGVDGFTFFTDFQCRINTYSAGCEGFMQTTIQFTVIIATCHACLTFILGISTYGFVVRLQKRQKLSKQANLESRLLLQSIFSSSLLVVLCGFELWAVYVEMGYTFNVLRQISNILFAFWHVLSIIMLIAVSKPFRVRFFQFYRLAKILNLNNSAPSKVFIARISQRTI